MTEDRRLEENLDFAYVGPYLGQAYHHPEVGEQEAPGMDSEDEEDQVVIRNCVPRRLELTMVLGPS